MPFKFFYAKKPSVVLNQSISLKQLVNKALYINSLQNCLNLYLQPIIKENCHIACFEQGILTLIVDQANWATRLRYQQHKLKQQLLTHAEFNGLTKIVVKVYPNSHPYSKQEYYLELSPAAAETIKETAEHINHPALKASLIRLAQHAHKN